MARLGVLGLGQKHLQDGQPNAGRLCRRAGLLAIGAAVALTAGMLGLQGASASPLPPNLVLTPNATWHSSTHYADWDSSGFCDTFAPPLSALDNDWAAGIGFPQTAAGFDHHHYGGPCWSWDDFYDRGAVQFDWSQVNSYVQAHGLKSATLSYQADQGDVSCVAQVQEDSTDLNTFDFNSGPIPAGHSLTPAPEVSGSHATVDVGAVVGLGVAFGGIDPHLHFVLTGKDESLSEQDNNSCTAILGNFKLTITPDH